MIAYHIRQSFRPGEVTPEEANQIGVEFAQRFLKGRNAFIVCTHIDNGREHIPGAAIWEQLIGGVQTIEQRNNPNVPT